MCIFVNACVHANAILILLKRDKESNILSLFLFEKKKRKIVWDSFHSLTTNFDDVYGYPISKELISDTHAVKRYPI